MGSGVCKSLTPLWEMIWEDTHLTKPSKHLGLDVYGIEVSEKTYQGRTSETQPLSLN
jgi:hypothetical protein